MLKTVNPERNSELGIGMTVDRAGLVSIGDPVS
jgi:hypothetical protein